MKTVIQVDGFANTLLKQINCHKNALQIHIAITKFYGTKYLWGPGPGPFTPSTPLLDGPEDKTTVNIISDSYRRF